MNWKTNSLFLCIFGFLKELRPTDPFLIDYLTGPWKNFTASQVNQDIFPVSTYSYLAVLLLVFLITDVVRYKPIIILCGLSGTIMYISLILAETLVQMYVSQFLYGVFCATEIAYFTYIYAKVDKSHYQKVTSHTRAAYLFGKFVAAVTAQLTTTFRLLDYHQLNFITIAALTAATVWAVFLPSVDQSIYFHQADNNPNRIDISLPDSIPIHTISNSPPNLHPSSSKTSPSLCMKMKRAFHLLWEHFLNAYTNTYVVKWSLWWAFATGGYVQVISYVQLLWQTSVENTDDIYNGAIEAVCTIIGAAAACMVGKLKLNWSVVGEATLAIFSFLEGALLIIASQTYDIWLSYVTYILVGAIYQTMITIASSEVAKHLSEDSYGLVFGINTFWALMCQSLLTFAVVSESTLALTIRQQFAVYGGYFIVLAVVFMVMAMTTVIRKCRNSKSVSLWSKNDSAQGEEIRF